MPLRVGLIGAGRIAGKHLNAFRQHPDVLQLTAVCDVDEAAAARVAQEFGLPAGRVYRDAEKLVREAPVDAVDICTIHDQHHAQAMAALDAGRHVLLEKPMAISMDQCQQIVSAAGKAGLTLMIAHNQRFKANYRALRRIVREGELGRIRAMRAESAMNVVGQAPPGHWVYDGHRAGGGVAISLGLHRIDLLRFLGGELRRVTASVCKNDHKLFYNGAEDYVFALMEFVDGGVAEIFATYTPWRAPWGESFVIYGEKGTAHAMPLAVRYNDPVLVASETRSPKDAGPRTGKSSFVPLPIDTEGLPTGDMYVDELLHFATCVRTGQEPISSGREMLPTMRAVFGIYESARTGKPVDLV